MTQKKDIGKILRQFGLVFVALFIIVFMSIKSDVFLTSQNIINILRQISINGILAVGMTFVILTGGIDLSVGSVVAITGVIVGSLLQSGTNWFLASLAALVISAICGVFNGWLISYVGFQPFIATLSTMTIGRGFAQVYSNGKPYTISDPSFKVIGQGYFLGIRVTFASGEQQEFTDSKALLQAIREELPFRSTTGFRFETLTDDPEVKKAVDDILLDFAGEDNSRRTCNYGLTETGKQALRKAADPSIPHTYAWFVMADTNTPQEIIRQDLTLEEAIQIYQDSNTSEKRLGVIKDGIATVDFVHFQSGEQQFFTDHEKLESFRSDLVVAEAMERLYQQLNQPDIGIRMGEM